METKKEPIIDRYLKWANKNIKNKTFRKIKIKVRKSDEEEKDK